MFHTSKIALLAGLGLTAFCFGCHMSPPAQPMPGQVADSHRAPRAVTAADQNNSPLMPDPNLTPGATLPVATGDICVPGYSKKVRNVPLDVKQQVYAEYGITSHQPGEYEVDHLISLELGGSNSIKNLWPQSYLTQPWNAHVKDALENELHAEVCSGKVDLPTAQHDISTDWIAAYKKYFHTTGPLSQANSAYTSRPSRRHSRHPLDRHRHPVPCPDCSGVHFAHRHGFRVGAGLGQLELRQVFPAWFQVLRPHQERAVSIRVRRPETRLCRGEGAVE